MENRCVICGEIIPEGREVCPNCEKGYVPKQEKDEIRRGDEQGMVLRPADRRTG